ncbi:SDR family mycofactocin-dependent oxidoreductase [compost metagenome]
MAVSGADSRTLSGLSERFPGQVLHVPGDLTNSCEAQAIGKRIARDWGALDMLLLNAGTCDYLDPSTAHEQVFERVISTNLLASKHCIETALPLLRQGCAAHLVAIANAITWLTLGTIGAATPTTGLGALLKAVKRELTGEEIDMTVVCPVPDHTLTCASAKSMLPVAWSPEKAAAYLTERLQSRPREIVFPALLLATLWPLPQQTQH